MKLKGNLKIDNRNLEIINNDDVLGRYNKLKEKIVNNFKKEIFHKIEVIKALKEIKDNKYYELDGYKSFNSFAKNFRIARTQVYEYLRIGNAIEEGLLEEQFVIENGINDAILFLRNKEGINIKKSKRNPIKPLRFQLKSQDSYDFYKSNTKFTSFLMDRLFSSKKDLIEEFMKEFKSLKGE
ncbi:chromosome replication/partitioning protein (plasmid) [Borrelia puertoricensis]|uniref:chromosome replication/partitioning protein n=1 Tax=Borrelia puertoricensis TaxID=2756107 RepID=UPI001FF52A85|nr:chromosome replication/partitioning protein [Borrelia puertoricensis]UPA18639.1 chromosome replication/partitioning protein [Borrelia puertoricensis]